LAAFSPFPCRFPTNFQFTLFSLPVEIVVFRLLPDMALSFPHGKHRTLLSFLESALPQFCRFLPFLPSVNRLLPSCPFDMGRAIYADCKDPSSISLSGPFSLSLSPLQPDPPHLRLSTLRGKAGPLVSSPPFRRFRTSAMRGTSCVFPSPLFVSPGPHLV